MTVNYTTNLALGQPVTGTESGTWGDDVNNSVTSYLDIAIAGGLAITITTTDVTLSLTQGTSSATNIGSTTAQYAILNVSGAMTAARNLILPSSSRQYVINNNTTGGFALTVKGAATTGVTMVNGESAHIYWNGSDYAKLSNAPGGAGTFTNLTYTGTLTGSTGVIAIGTNQIYKDSSGNVGIGTSSPAEKLNVVGGNIKTDASSRQIGYWEADTIHDGYFIGYNSSGQSELVNSYATGGILFKTGNSKTERMRIDSSGNVGIGVTPSAWVSNRRALQIGGSASAVLALNGTSAVSEMYFNSYLNASAVNTYAATSYAGLFDFNSSTAGGFAWKLAPSGTAGNAISFTQAMTLDASGNLGIGTSSPTYKLELGTGAISFSGSTSAQINNFRSTDLELVSRVAGYGITFYYGAGSYAGKFDSSGNLLVGATTTGVTGVGIKFQTTNSVVLAVSANTTNATDTYNMYSTGAGAYRFYVDWAGTIHATSTVITAISDQRLKENVRDIDTGLDAVMLLKPRRFDWKEGKGQDKKNVAGFIAQEFEQIFPESVGVSKAGEDGIEYKNINYETLIPTLVKAIQEQQALITSLTARIEALEAR